MKAKDEMRESLNCGRNEGKREMNTYDYENIAKR